VRDDLSRGDDRYRAVGDISPHDRCQMGAGRKTGGLSCSLILLTQVQYFT